MDMDIYLILLIVIHHSSVHFIDGIQWVFGFSDSYKEIDNWF